MFVQHSFYDEFYDAHEDSFVELDICNRVLNSLSTRSSQLTEQEIDKTNH
jgi:hypothetical protein